MQITILVDFGPVSGQSWGRDPYQRFRLDRCCINLHAIIPRDRFQGCFVSMFCSTAKKTKSNRGHKSYPEAFVLTGPEPLERVSGPSLAEHHRFGGSPSERKPSN